MTSFLQKDFFYRVIASLYTFGECSYIEGKAVYIKCIHRKIENTETILQYYKQT